MLVSKRLQQDFGEAAERYDAYGALQRHVRAQGLALAFKHFSPAGHVLDVGAGTGAFAQEAQAMGTAWGITSLDLAWGMCAKAKQRCCHTVQADAGALPFADGAFSGVFSSLMLQWNDTPGEVFREISRILAPGGTAVLATLVEGTLAELQDAFRAVDDAQHTRRFLPAHRLLEAAGEAGLALRLARQNTEHEYYPDVVALMRALQAIGASHKQAGQGRGLLTPRKLARLEHSYRERHASAQGLRASWQLLYVVLGK